VRTPEGEWPRELQHPLPAIVEVTASPHSMGLSSNYIP